MPRFCQLCGRTIQQQASLYHHPSWEEGKYLRVCLTCRQVAPRCLVCNIPSYSLDAHKLCPSCVTTMPHCLLCSAPIMGEYLSFSGRGPYCLACVNQRAACDVCGVPVDDGGQLLSDGRRICGQCHITAVYDLTKALPVYDQVKGIITQKLGLVLNVPTILILVGRDQLSSILRQANHNTENVTHLLGIYMRQGRKRAIYAQSGLPRLLLMQVIAHEWGHAWQMENAPLMQNLQAKEGFAEWVAYKVMLVIGAKQALERMVSRSDLYGEGLRHVLHIEHLHGEAGVLTWCRQAR